MCTRSRERARTPSDWDLLGLYEQGDTEHPFIRARLVAQETKRTTKMDLTDASMTFAATPPVEGFRFLLSRAMTGDNGGTHRMSWS